jgi:hypothetical protein
MPIRSRKLGERWFGHCRLIARVTRLRGKRGPSWTFLGPGCSSYSVMFHRVVALRSRSYVLSRSRPSLIKNTLLAARVSTGQTNSTNGNAETVDSSYPAVTEADIANQSEIIKNPAESIPSSGALTLPPTFDAPPTGSATDWSRSYHGLSTQPFPPEVADILLASIDPLDIEMKPGTSFCKLS